MTGTTSAKHPHVVLNVLAHVRTMYEPLEVCVCVFVLCVPVRELPSVVVDLVG